MTQALAQDGRTRPPAPDFSLTLLWRILVVRRRVILLTVAGCLLAAAAISLCLPTRYVADSRIEINPENAAAIDLPGHPSDAAAEYAVTLGTQQQVLASDTLALQVIRQLKLEEIENQRSYFRSNHDERIPLEQSPARRSRALKRFHRNLSVEIIGGTRMIRVSYRDRDPALTAAVVNAVVNGYLEQYFQTRYTATRQASEWLSGQVASLKKEVETSDQRLAEYQRRTGILGESETNNIVMAKLEDVNRQLSAAEANRIVKEAVWQLAKSGDPELISSVAGSSFVQGVGSAPNPTQFGLLPSLRAQEAQLKADIAQTASRVGPNFPKLLQMRSHLAELESSIDAEVAKISARAENDYLAAKNAEDMERALLEKQKGEANKLNNSAVEYGILKREADARRDLYQGMVAKLKQAGVFAGLRSSNIVVVDPARPPAKPSSPNLLLNLLIGLVVGTFGGIGIALIQDGTDTTIRSPQDVQSVAEVPVLAVLPLVRDHNEQGTREAAERFRALRTSLLLCEPKRAHVIMVTSALAGEGKSTVSANLARAFAQQGERVLQVDADLRKSSVRYDFVKGVKSAGLGDILAQPTVHSDRTPWLLVDGVHVISAGEPPELPAELLGSTQIAEMLTTWRQQFDRIIIDTPPVLSFTDAVMVARLVDLALLVVRAGSTSAEALARTVEALQLAKPPIAAVVNRMDFRSPGYKHYYGHSYASREIQEHHA